MDIDRVRNDDAHAVYFVLVRGVNLVYIEFTYFLPQRTSHDPLIEIDGAESPDRAPAPGKNTSWHYTSSLRTYNTSVSRLVHQFHESMVDRFVLWEGTGWSIVVGKTPSRCQSDRCNISDIACARFLIQCKAEQDTGDWSRIIGSCTMLKSLSVLTRELAMD